VVIATTVITKHLYSKGIQIRIVGDLDAVRTCVLLPLQTRYKSVCSCPPANPIQPDPIQFIPSNCPSTQGYAPAGVPKMKEWPVSVAFPAALPLAVLGYMEAYSVRVFAIIHHFSQGVARILRYRSSLLMHPLFPLHTHILAGCTQVLAAVQVSNCGGPGALRVWHWEPLRLPLLLLPHRWYVTRDQNQS
jgi:hypothetical protein